MEKISEEKLAAVLVSVPETLRALDQERDHWRERAEAAEGELQKIAHRERIEKIADAMEAKGLDLGRDRGERIAFLEKKADGGQLEAVEQAVEMSAPQGSGLGELIESTPGQGLSDLENYLLGEL